MALNQKAIKVLGKVFEAGFTDEKSIAAMTMDDILAIQGITIADIGIINELQKSIKARLHYLLKDDLMKMEAITQETRLLCRNRIDTVEQLLSYKGSLETEKTDLLQKRKELYSISRKTGGEEKEAIRSQLSDLSKRLSVIRKEVKLCESIEARNAALKEKLSTIRADEEQQRKELMTNEYKRRSGRTNRPNELGRI